MCDYLTTPGPRSQAKIFDRLVATGIRAEAVTKAIALAHTGRADLIQRVIDGKLDLERAAQIARRQVRT
jgi:hypothetical protein